MDQGKLIKVCSSYLNPKYGAVGPKPITLIAQMKRSRLQLLWRTLTSDSSEIVVNLSNSLDYFYAPASSGNSSWQSSFNEDQRQMPNHQERKFLIAESALLSLFNFCVKCGNKAEGHINHRMETFINIIEKCDFCSHKRSWNSQPFFGSIPAGNLHLSAVILFAGAIYTQALRIFEFLKIFHTNIDIFCIYQRFYLQSTIKHFWHCAKGFKKKMFWTRSVTNHMYWVAASPSDGNKAVMLAKWCSIVNHIQYIHDGHGDLFPECLHDNLEGHEAKKKWLKPYMS